MRKTGTGSIFMRPYSSDASIFGGTSGKARPLYRIYINGVRYGDYVYRIISMYAVGDLFGQGPLFDLREVHHIDDDVNNWKPSNLMIVENRRQHKILDLWCRAQKLSGIFVPIRLKGAVYVGDIITDDNFDIEIALDWWCEMMRET
jgi:hypothetical protein